MSIELLAVLGILAGAVGVLDTLPYIRDTVRRRTSPHRGTWLIWGVLAVVALLSQHSDGARWSLVMTATQALLTCLIFAIAIRYGQGGLSRPDILLIGLAALGVAGWLLVDEPAVATSFVVAADIVAIGMMMPKTYRDPDSETLSTFALASVSGLLAAGAVGALDATLLLYPVYYALGNGVIAAVIVVRRRALAGQAAPRMATAEA